KITEDVAKLLKSPNETVIASIKTIKPEYKSIDYSFEVTGIVTYDTRLLYTISTRVGGRLEKVNLKYAFQNVTKGQKVAEIYSPELVTAQRELLFLLSNDASNTSLIESAKNKLYLLGMTESQVNSIINKKEAISTIAVYSNFNGYLIANNQQAPVTNAISTTATSSSGMNAMGGSSSASQTNETATVSNEITREGIYVSAGQTLFTIVNSASHRIELNVPSPQVGAVKKGSTVHLDFGNNQQEHATVDFVQPFFSEGEEFLKLRVITHKMDDVHIGHPVTGKLSAKSSETYWIPSDAVFDSGTEQLVFVKERGAFKPKKITTGIQANGLVEVKSGLASSDEIAAQASYLIDSESFVKQK
ncbi:MAG TPA: efflux RND transporter periplasmic adaptor subunit, partial [Flavitalea sp.]|nr:efflux RND transporter periplasmic adaptor subunit [Flavitalea sp.]